MQLSAAARVMINVVSLKTRMLLSPSAPESLASHKAGKETANKLTFEVTVGWGLTDTNKSA